MTYTERLANARERLASRRRPVSDEDFIALARCRIAAADQFVLAVLSYARAMDRADQVLPPA
jgi:hypothetical protein